MAITLSNRGAGRRSSVEGRVQREVQRRVDKCPYKFIYCNVVAEFEDGLLTLRGKVPSFYLKQMLQEFVRGIEHVVKIDNQVDVVCSNGLSSVRPKKPR